MPSVMDRDTFVRKQSKGWDSAEDFLTYHEVSPCDCGKKKCRGWQVRWMFGAERRRKSGDQRQRATAPSSKTGYIYFARLGDLIKIGYSKDPELRAQSLSAELLATCMGDREYEAELHSEFGDLRERGEWFRTDPRLLERIEALGA